MIVIVITTKNNSTETTTKNNPPKCYSIIQDTRQDNFINPLQKLCVLSLNILHVIKHCTKNNDKMSVSTQVLCPLFQNKVVKYWPDENSENKEREFVAMNVTYRVKFLSETSETDYIRRELLLIREPHDDKVGFSLLRCAYLLLEFSDSRTASGLE